MSAGEPAGEALRVVRGQPTPEELAAVSAVLYALAAQRREQRRAQAEREEREYWDLVAAEHASSRSLLRRLRRAARPWTAIPFPTWRAWRG
ncbi:acyl-CoA carboxylase subunit epsilon [Streptomyces sp. IBSBF 2953]|uniref:acyl-CoA carboxylase subunit epsilon n=1 Tax=Streptomyces TaxID=1883 RepID=UPI00211A2F28|nr:acyl-CoA carboxylase subunit epsilon [Streptomyces scabiei]MCQ9184202.1 acyl-CoA carboxylase subunit epsilon [Streptomyces hayashii]MDX3117940.1 acyl-CoA carboxylase subunit epsilon [Streptomyces scabiei]